MCGAKRKRSGIGMGAVRSYVRHGVRSAWSVISRGCGGEGRRRAAEARGARGAACNDDGGSGRWEARRTTDADSSPSAACCHMSGRNKHGRCAGRAKRKRSGIGMGAVRSYVRHGVRSAWSVISRGCGGERGRRAVEGARCSCAAGIGCGELICQVCGECS